MNKMNKIIILIIFNFVGVTATAQNVSYYKLSSIRHGGNTNKSVSGGQFITFLSDICYESDNKGMGVGHGSLSRNNGYSNSQYTVYQGSSYWGKSTTFKFNADKSVLNVVLDNGDVYVYKRATAPAGQETCSLIRKPGGGGGGSVVVTPTPTIIDPYNPTPTPNPIPNPNPDPNPRKLVYETVKCTRCNGTGQMPYDTYPPMFGQPDSDVWCGTCSRYYKKSRGHTHVTCTECKGSGTVTKTRVSY